MPLIKKKLGGASPVDAAILEKISGLVQQQVERVNTYMENFNMAKEEYIKDFEDRKKKIDENKINKMAHKKAGIETMKEEISGFVWDQIEGDIDTNVRKTVNNDLAVKAAMKGAEKVVAKAVETVIDKTMDRGN